MAKISIRNRNKDLTDRDGKSKKPNWEYRFSAASINGKRKFISKSGFTTKKEAEIEGAKAFAEYNRTGQHFVPSEISVADFFDYWLKNHCEVNLADSTTASYSSIIQNHIKPSIGIYRLKSIDTLTLQEFINTLHTEKHLSKEFINTILKMLKQAFQYAQKKAKYINDNPSLEVTLPNVDVLDEDILVLSKEDVATILDRFKRNPCQYYAILIAYYTGLRISEVYGLTWDCIDFTNKTLTVNKICKKFDYNSKGKTHRGIRGHAETIWYLGACKTKSSFRTIQIGDTLINALQDYKEWQEHNAKEYGKHYTKTYIQEELSQNNRNVQRIVQTTDTKNLPNAELVCLNENGSFSGTDSMKHPSRVINKQLGIEFNFHALRHTHATMLIEQGVPIKAVSKRLGHSSTKITWDIYVKVTQKMETEVVETFEAESGLQLRDEELYAVWKHTINKCNSNTYYTQRGVNVWDEWQDYSVFAKWATENGWCSGFKLIRIDKTGNYTPDNCMFGTETKSIRGQYIYADGENIKSYSVRKIGRGWQYRITYYNLKGERSEITKAGFETENAAALAAEAVISDMFNHKLLISEKQHLRKVQ